MEKETRLNELMNRWVTILRGKASQYEHLARHNGDSQSISAPDLDSIASEIEAFFVGLDKSTMIRKIY